MQVSSSAASATLVVTARARVQHSDQLGPQAPLTHTLPRRGGAGRGGAGLARHRQEVSELQGAVAAAEARAAASAAEASSAAATVKQLQRQLEVKEEAMRC